MALHLDLDRGDRLVIGGTVIDVGDKSGRKVRVRIDTNADVQHVKGFNKPADEESPRPAVTRPGITRKP